YEDEIRALGDHCVLPLARYIQSSAFTGPLEQRRRVQAARILSDVAQPWSIPELITLLKNPDGEVRYYAARGLNRLAGPSQAMAAEQFRDRSPDQLAPMIDRWQHWWDQNKDRYPAGPMGALK